MPCIIEYCFMFLLASKRTIRTFFTISAALFMLFTVEAQPMTGQLAGKILASGTLRELADVRVTNVSTGKSTVSGADGSFSIRLTQGLHTLLFEADNFQPVSVGQIDIRFKQVSYLNVLLIARHLQATDSLPKSNAAAVITERQARMKWRNEQLGLTFSRRHHLSMEEIDENRDQTTSHLLQRLAGVIVSGNYDYSRVQSLNVNGMGERYNQVRINNIPFYSQTAGHFSYPFDIIPAESIKEINLRFSNNASLPGGGSAGTVDIMLRNMPEANFVYISAGGSAVDGTTGKRFFGDKLSRYDVLGWLGNMRNLPPDFPTSRSRVSYGQLNPQEKFALARNLPNTLAPGRHGNSRVSENALAGFGRRFLLQGNRTLGFIAFVRQQTSERQEEVEVQSSPDVKNNPYPFADLSRSLVQFHSHDIRYRRFTALSAMLASSLEYGRNKISLSVLGGKSLSSVFANRNDMYKPDEDSAARAGIYYSTAQRTFISSQLSGIHALGGGGRFKLNWEFQHFFQKQNFPDERNFLLRRDSSTGTTFEIAHSSAKPYVPNIQNVDAIDPNLVNTSRKWKELEDHGFSGAVTIAVPMSVTSEKGILSGGIFIQNLNRKLHSDILFVQGSGFYPLSQLAAAERYYPGGLSVQSYRATNPGSRNVYANQLGNYTGSSNTGAAFVRAEAQLMRRLSADFGLRMETVSQLVSNTQYNYVPGLRHPQMSTLDENLYTANVDVLPSAKLVYTLAQSLHLQASWFLAVVRPELQELTKYREYDGLSSMITMGNPALRSSGVMNYSASIVWLPSSRVHLEVGGFHKRIVEPIEYILTSYTPGAMLSTATNMSAAIVKGITSYASAQIGNQEPGHHPFGLTMFVSANITSSTVHGGPARSFLTPSITEHSLSGTPAFTVNAGVQFYPFAHTQLALWYNRIGESVSMVGSGDLRSIGTGKYLTIPNYRVGEREQLDVQITQKLFHQRLALSAGINNVTDGRYIQYQDLNGNGRFDNPITLKNGLLAGGLYTGGTDNTVLSVRFGQTYLLTASYLFK